MLAAAGGGVEAMPGGALTVTGLDVSAIGDTAAANGIPLYEVTPHSASLEDAYMELAARCTEFGARLNHEGEFTREGRVS